MFLRALIPTCLATGLFAAFAAPGLADQAAPADHPASPVAAPDSAETARRIDILAEEIERLKIGRAFVRADQSKYGLGPAASKVYRGEPGLSIGGYGELQYFNNLPGSDQIDLHRVILYSGYKFNDSWVFNSEIEFEHIDELEVEFAYIDYLIDPRLNLRMGHVLVPMGIMNELHEPTTYLSVERAEVERRILPSTWHENGVGVFGEWGPVAYKLYLVNGFDAAKYKPASDGLGDLRQKGSKALINDPAGVARVDFVGLDGLVVGASGYVGQSDQDQFTDVAGEEIASRTMVLEAHADWRWRGLSVRGLATQAKVDGAAELNTALGFSSPASTVAEVMEGYYAEVGYDVFSLLSPGERSLTPWVRYTYIDTAAAVPAGKVAAAGLRRDRLEFGLAFKPIEQVVVKTDYVYMFDKTDGNNQLRAALGFIF